MKQLSHGWVPTFTIKPDPLFLEVRTSGMIEDVNISIATTTFEAFLMQNSMLFVNAAAVDWSTEANPVGQKMTSTVHDQGKCGACWAFVTASAVEVSVRLNGWDNAPLSVQELLDCDLDYNKGCLGGDPSNSFQYVIKNGLASWKNYPYVGEVCQSISLDILSMFIPSTKLTTRSATTMPTASILEAKQHSRFYRHSIPRPKFNNASSCHDRSSCSGNMWH